ncbi:MAG: 30S ribosomal protein S6 [Thermodesulfobacteriota bacterium]|nr:30S ribosomal protein S6 [Thermodesulfobacteriota bacterium]
MRGYETIFILDPDIPDEDADSVIQRLTGIVEEFGCKIIKIEKWGKKKLAYRIKKKTKGNYVLFNFFGDHKLTTELERILRLDDRVLKYLTVRIDKFSELDLAKEEAEKEEAEKEETEKEEKVEEHTEKRDAQVD